jgi:glycosyltransferase involved in cell wall biosynthesis
MRLLPRRSERGGPGMATEAGVLGGLGAGAGKSQENEWGEQTGPASRAGLSGDSEQRRTPHIVIGVTHPQTCLTLTGRLKALREAGFRVTLVSSPERRLYETAAREGVAAIGLPMVREIAPLADLISLLRLVRLLLRLSPDVAEFSTPKAGLLGSLAALVTRVPARVYMLRGLKLETATGLKRVLLRAAERTAARCAQTVLCNSSSMRDEALALGLVPERKLRMIGEGSSNGVNTERFSPGPSTVRAQWGIPEDARVVGFVGRLTRDKGVPDLVEAFDSILARLPDAHLLLVGWYDEAEDALDAGCRARIGQHPRIHATGFRHDTERYYRAMDVMVLPTWREGFPNVVLEASATGVPVVTTISTGSQDSVIPEVTGLLIPPGYPEAISEAVLKLLGDPERRRRMGEAGRAWVGRVFSDEYVLRLAVGFYKGLLKPAGERSRDAGPTARTRAT